MLIGVVAAGKATGVTTIAAGLGAAFGADGEDAMVIEADVDGGDLAYLRDLNVDDGGVLSFAAQMGADGRDAVTAIESHLWRNDRSSGSAVMPLSAGGAGVEAQIAALWADGREVLQRWPGPVVIDLGRWGHALTAEIWNGCDLGVVVCPGSVAGLRRAEATWMSPPLRNPFATWRIVNGSPWTVDQIKSDTGLMFDAVFEWDRRCAEAIRVGNWSGVRRRHLARQLSVLTEQISTDRQGVRP